MPPSISICMIVRDEEEALGRCLESVRGVVDEVVVVDTGSRDRTRELAAQFGAHVYDLPWPDDFAAARNWALDRALCEWALILDADDILRSGDAERLRSLPDLGGADGYACRTLSLVGDPQAPSEVSSVQLRLVRLGLGYRYVGRIHERLDIPPERVRFADIAFYHYGYLGDVVRRRDKIRRNLSLLERDLSERPEDPFVLFNLGTEHVRLGAWEDAIDLFRRARTLVDRAGGWAPELYKKLAICLLETGRTAEAEDVIGEGVKAHPDFTDLHFLRGCLHHRTGQLGKAVEAFSHCLRLGEPAPEYPSDVGCGSYRARFGLGLVLSELGRRNEAHKTLRKAVAEHPDLLDAYAPLVATMDAADDPTVLVEVVAADGQNGRARLSSLAEAMLLGRSVEEALSVLAVGDVEPESRALVLLAAGRPEEGLVALREASGRRPRAATLLAAISPPDADPAVNPEPLANAERLVALLLAVGEADAADRIAVAAPEKSAQKLLRAQVAIWRGDALRAIELLRAAQAEKPHDQLLGRGLAAARAAAGDFAAAQTILAELVARSPSQHALYLDWAKVLVAHARAVGNGHV